MSGFEVVREERISYDALGQRTVSERSYVNLSVSLRDWLKQLAGARLSCLVVLALNESEISLGRSDGLTIKQIANETNVSPRNVLRVMQYLCKGNFASELDERGPHGEKLYRVKGCAWFGGKRAHPSASNRQKPSQTDVPAGRASTHDKMSPLNAPNVRPAPNVRGMTKPAGSSSSYKQPEIDLETTTSLEGGVGGTTAQQLLLSVGIFSARDFDVTDEQAHAIAEAVQSGRIKAGYAYGCLKKDPRWQPEPEPKRKTWYGDEYSDFVKR